LSYAINFAPFHFLKEVAVHDRRFGLRGIIFNDEEIDTRMNGAVRFPTMLSRIAKIKAAPSFGLRVYRSKPESADCFAVVPKSGRAVGRKLWFHLAYLTSGQEAEMLRRFRPSRCRSERAPRSSLPRRRWLEDRATV